MSFVRRTAARLSSPPSGPAASTAAQRKGSDLDPIMEDYGTDGSRSGGLSTSATFTTDDGEPRNRDNAGRPRTSDVKQFQMQDLKSVQHRCAVPARSWCRLRDRTELEIRGNAQSIARPAQTRLQNSRVTGSKFTEFLLPVEVVIGGVNTRIHVSIFLSVVECHCIE